MKDPKPSTSTRKKHFKKTWSWAELRSLDRLNGMKISWAPRCWCVLGMFMYGQCMAMCCLDGFTGFKVLLCFTMFYPFFTNKVFESMSLWGILNWQF